MLTVFVFNYQSGFTSWTVLLILCSSNILNTAFLWLEQTYAISCVPMGVDFHEGVTLQI